MDADFSVTPALRGGCRVLVLEGDLDMAQASALDAALGSFEDDLPLVVDLSSLAFVDSTGLHVLLGRDRGRPAAIVCAPGSNVARVLDIVNVRESVPVYGDVAEAVAHVGTAT